MTLVAINVEAILVAAVCIVDCVVVRLFWMVDPMNLPPHLVVSNEGRPGESD